jgi:hypothetical protein
MMTGRSWTIVAVLVVASNLLTGFFVWRLSHPVAQTPEPAPVAKGESPKEKTNSDSTVEEPQTVTDWQRCKMLLEAEKSAKDPVALALPAAYSSGDMTALTGIAILGKHLDDPRAERALSQLAKGPKEPRGGEVLLPGKAEQAEKMLRTHRAAKEYETVMHGATARPDKVGRIRAFIKEHPEYTNPKTCPDQNDPLFRLLLTTIKEEDDDAHVELLLLVNRWPVDYASRHPEQFVEYLKRLGRVRTFAQPAPFDPYTRARLFEALRKEPTLIPLVESWLKDATDHEEVDYLVRELRHAPDAQKRLLPLLQEDRPYVIERAVSGLRNSSLDRTSLAAIRDCLSRRKRAGASKEEVNYLEAVIENIAKEIAEKEGNQQP